MFFFFTAQILILLCFDKSYHLIVQQSTIKSGVTDNTSQLLHIQLKLHSNNTPLTKSDEHTIISVSSIMPQCNQSAHK